jgi:hypothetical protein
MGEVKKGLIHSRPRPAAATWGSRVGDPAQVAYAVAVRILEAARIDLVDHRAAPPVGIEGHGPDAGQEVGGTQVVGHGSSPFRNDLDGGVMADGPRSVQSATA